jgi:uncharacterized phage protein (TIGR02220 family)
MDWENERFVKLYTRDTPDWVVLSWEARALFLFLMRKVDRAGVLTTRHGIRGVAALVGMPVDVVERALPELVEDGCVVQHDGSFGLANFADAQEARQSNAARQRASRSRKRGHEDVAGTAHEPDVSGGHTASRDVTRGHAESHRVTTRLDQTRSDQTRLEEEGEMSGADATRPRLAETEAVDNSVACEPQPACSSRPAHGTAPERAHLPQDATNAPTPQVDSGPEFQPASDPPTRSGEALVLALVPAHPKADPVRAFAEAAVTALNRETGHTYRADSEAVLKSARQLVAKRFTPADAIAVVEAKVAAWRHDPKMAEYLRPTTLLRPSNFAAYVDDLRAGNKPRVGQHDRRGPSPQHTSVLGALLDRQAELEALEQAGAMS